VIGIGIGIGSRAYVAGSAPVIDSDAQAYSNALAVPLTSGRLLLVSDFVTGLKADGVWTGLDWILLTANETTGAALRNLKNPAKAATAVNSPTFTVDRGYQGDAISMHIDLGEVPNAVGNSFSLNSACAGIWTNAQGSTASQRVFGQAAGATLYMNARGDGTGNEVFSANDATGNNYNLNSTTKSGHRAFSRTGAAIKRAFLAGVRTFDGTTASTSITASNLTVLRGGTLYADVRVAAFYSGGGMSDAQMASIHTRLSTLMTAIGA
jgi:hypothetical protein